MLDEFGLVGDPLLLHLGDVLLHFVDLLLDVILFCLEGACILVLAVLLLKLIELPVEAVDLVLLLGDLDVLLLDLALELLHVTFLVLKLVDQVLELLLQQIVLGVGVEVINADTRDLVCDVLDLDLLLGDSLVGDFGLLDEVGARFLDSLLLGGVVDDVVSDGLGLGVQLHHALLKDSHLLLHIGALHIHAGALLFGRLQGGLEHNILLLKSLLVRLDFVSACFQEVLLALALGKLFVEFF